MWAKGPPPHYLSEGVVTRFFGGCRFSPLWGLPPQGGEAIMHQGALKCGLYARTCCFVAVDTQASLMLARRLALTSLSQSHQLGPYTSRHPALRAKCSLAYSLSP